MSEKAPVLHDLGKALLGDACDLGYLLYGLAFHKIEMLDVQFAELHKFLLLFLTS